MSEESAKSESSSLSETPRRPFDDVPKLDHAEAIDLSTATESGFLTQSTPESSENYTSQLHIPPIHIPPFMSQHTYNSQQAIGASQSQTSSSTENAGDRNGTEQYNATVAAPIQARELHDDKDQLALSEQTTTGHVEAVENPVQQSILRLIDSKNARIKELEKQQSEHEKKLQKVTEDKEKLEFALKEKTKETETKNEEYEQRIKNLESQLQEKDKEVDNVRKRLSETERESEVDKKQLEEEIKRLEKEKKELEANFSQLQSDRKDEDIKNRTQIVELEEKLNEKEAEKNKQYRELCDLKVKLAQAEVDVANSKALIEKQNAELLNKELELTKEKDENRINKIQRESQERFQELEKEIELLRKKNEYFKQKGKANTDQSTPPSTDQQPSSTPPPERENSRTESTGAVNPSDTENIQSTGATQALTPSECDSVHFEVVSDDDSTLDLSSKTED